jgi:hypothetical protein
MLGGRRLADSIQCRAPAQAPGMGHIPEKLAIPKDHLEDYSISISDIVKDLEFV